MKNYIKISSITILALLLISLGVYLFAHTTILSALRIVFGSVYVLFIPGFIITYIFFPKTKPFDEKESKSKNKESEKDKGAIDLLERIALSFALSIAIVPLIVFYLNLIGIKINLLNSFLTIAGIILVSVIILKVRLKKARRI